MTQHTDTSHPQLAVDTMQSIHERAEERVNHTTAPLMDSVETLSPHATRQLLHDLKVHQMELEMQNDELRQTQAKLSALQEHYSDLFDFAPVGYVTLNVQGILMQANLTAAQLLGVQRSVLSMLPMTRYILKQDHDIFQLHLSQILAHGENQSFDLRMLKTDGNLFWANLTLTAVSKYPNTAMFRLVISDITERKQAQAVFHGLFDQSVFLGCILDKRFRLMDVNRAALNLMDTPRNALIGQYFPDHPWWSDGHNQAQLINALQQALCGVGVNFETCHTLSNDRQLHLMVSTMPIFLDTGIQVAFVGVDITQRKQAEHMLQESEKFFHDFFESNSSVMLLVEPTFGQIIDANRSATTFYGYPREQLIGMFLCHINTQIPERMTMPTQPTSRAGRHCLLNTHRLSSGDIRHVEIYSTPIEMAGRALLFSIIHDVTARYLLEQQVHQLAFHDALTQLPNRSLLGDRMTQAMATSHRSACYCALMMLDLDNFKPLNDLHGHLVGDLLLVEVARRLTHCVREIDTVARFGGDEFVVMLGELSTDEAESTAQAAIVAEKIRQSLSDRYQLTVSGHPNVLIEHRCTVSIGVLIFANKYTLLDNMLKWADAAMYQAKSDGGNRVRFYAPESAG